MDITTFLVLYLAFRFKHFMCDWILQTPWMALEKGHAFQHGGLLPLLTHAAIHSAGTFIIVMIVTPSLWWLAPLDFLIHGAIDRIKAVLTAKKNLQPQDRWYWWAIGIDQEAHNLTHLGYIMLMYQVM